MIAAPPLRVLLIDDAPLLRRALAAQLAAQAGLHATACDGSIPSIRAQLITLHPDVVIVDLGLRSTDAISILRRLRTHYPVPTLVLADAPAARGERSVEALEAGALEVLPRPTSLKADAISDFALTLALRIRHAAQARRPGAPLTVGLAPRAGFGTAGLHPAEYVVVVGASTGGPEALRGLIESAPADFPPTVIVQHIPAAFTRSLAARLASTASMRVTEAIDGEPLRVGCALIARGDTHLTIRPAAGGWVARYTHQQPVNGHCPSVDVLFDSAVPAGKRAIAILLTGMGADGAAGLLRLHQAGALTIAQDAASSVVYGMPKVAAQLGAARLSAAPAEMPGLILKTLRSERTQPAAPRAARG